MAYNYKSPLNRGYAQFKLSRKQHNLVFSNRKIKWFNKCEYFYNDEKIIIHIFIRPIAVFLNTLLLPLTLVINGIVNAKEIWKSISEDYNQKNSGSFSSHCIYKHEKRYKEIMEIINK